MGSPGKSPLIKRRWKKVVLIAICFVLVLSVAVSIIKNVQALWSLPKILIAAQQHRQYADFAEAEKLYRLALRRFAENPIKTAETMCHLGFLFIETKRYSQARDIFQSIVEDYSDQTLAVFSAQLGLADLLVLRGDQDQAEKQLQALTDRYAASPEVVRAWQRLLDIAITRKDYERAKRLLETELFDRSLIDDSFFRDVHFQMAQLLSKQGNIELVLEEYREIQQLFHDVPTLARAKANMVGLESERRRFAAAEDIQLELSKQFASEVDSLLDGELFIAGALLGEEKREQEGCDRLRELIRKNPGAKQTFWAAVLLSEYYSLNGQHGQGEQTLRSLMQTDMADAKLRHKLQMLLAKFDILHGRLAEAGEKLQVVLDQSYQNDTLIFAALLMMFHLPDEFSRDEMKKIFERLEQRVGEDKEMSRLAALGEGYADWYGDETADRRAIAQKWFVKCADTCREYLALSPLLQLAQDKLCKPRCNREDIERTFQKVGELGDPLLRADALLLLLQTLTDDTEEIRAANVYRIMQTEFGEFDYYRLQGDLIWANYLSRTHRQDQAAALWQKISLAQNSSLLAQTKTWQKKFARPKQRLAEGTTP